MKIKLFRIFFWISPVAIEVFESNFEIISRIFEKYDNNICICVWIKRQNIYEHDIIVLWII